MTKYKGNWKRQILPSWRDDADSFVLERSPLNLLSLSLSVLEDCDIAARCRPEAFPCLVGPPRIQSSLHNGYERASPIVQGTRKSAAVHRRTEGTPSIVKTEVTKLDTS